MVTIHEAAMNGDVQTVRTLLAQGADPNARHDDGVSLLETAVRFSQADIVRVLLAHGADPNSHEPTRYMPQVTPRGVEGEAALVTGDYSTTPLHEVARVDEVAIARLLVEAGAEVNALDSLGCTPLDWALHFDNPKVAALLTEAGAVTREFTAGAAPAPHLYAGPYHIRGVQPQQPDHPAFISDSQWYRTAWEFFGSPSDADPAHEAMQAMVREGRLPEGWPWCTAVRGRLEFMLMTAAGAPVLEEMRAWHRSTYPDQQPDPRWPVWLRDAQILQGVTFCAMLPRGNADMHDRAKEGTAELALESAYRQLLGDLPASSWGYVYLLIAMQFAGLSRALHSGWALLGQDLDWGTVLAWLDRARQWAEAAVEALPGDGEALLWLRDLEAACACDSLVMCDAETDSPAGIGGFPWMLPPEVRDQGVRRTHAAIAAEPHVAHFREHLDVWRGAAQPDPEWAIRGALAACRAVVEYAAPWTRELATLTEQGRHANAQVLGAGLLGRLNAAASQLEGAVSRAAPSDLPSHASDYAYHLYWQLGAVHYAQGDHQGHVSYLQHAMGYNDVPMDHMILAEALWNSGDPTGAEKHYAIAANQQQDPRAAEMARQALAETAQDRAQAKAGGGGCALLAAALVVGVVAAPLCISFWPR